MEGPNTVGRRTPRSNWLALVLIPILMLALAAFSGAQPDTAIALYRQKKFPEAARTLEQYLIRRPDDFPARLLLGLCYQESLDRAAAERVFRDAAERRPNDRAARYYLARVQYLRARFADAEANARLAMKLGEPPAHVDDLIGLIRAEQNALDGALAAYDAAIRADRDFADPYLNAGVLLLKLGRTSEALGRLTTAIEKSPQSAEAFYQRARAYLQLNKPAEAEKDLLQSVSLAQYEPGRRLLAQLRSGVGTAPARTAPAVSPAPIQFRNVAESAGLRFVLENNPTPQKRLIETMAGGVAAFDYNNDGLTDIYFTNGASIPSLEKDSPKYFNRLYRNDGGMKFTDVTEEAGGAGAGCSTGGAGPRPPKDRDGGPVVPRRR